MKTAGRLIAALIGKLAARMQDGKNDLQGVLAGFMHSDRHTAAIISDGTGTVFVDLNDYFVPKTVDRFIDRVIDDLPHQMVQTSGVDRTDIHARSFTDRFKTF